MASGYSRNLNKKIFLNVFNDYEYDAFQSLDLRITGGGGAGYNLFKREKSLAERGGRRRLLPCKIFAHPMPSYSQSSGEFYYGDDYALKVSTRTSLTQAFRMFNNLSDTGQYRVNFDLGGNTQLFKWLTLEPFVLRPLLEQSTGGPQDKRRALHHRVRHHVRDEVAVGRTIVFCGLPTRCAPQ